MFSTDWVKLLGLIKNWIPSISDPCSFAFARAWESLILSALILLALYISAQRSLSRLFMVESISLWGCSPCLLLRWVLSDVVSTFTTKVLSSGTTVRLLAWRDFAILGASISPDKKRTLLGTALKHMEASLPRKPQSKHRPFLKVCWTHFPQRELTKRSSSNRFL